MQVIESGIIIITLGVFLGIISMGGMLAAYPVYRKVFDKTKQKLAARSLELTAELAGKKSL